MKNERIDAIKLKKNFKKCLETMQYKNSKEFMECINKNTKNQFYTEKIENII